MIAALGNFDVKITESDLYYIWINTFKHEITSWGPSLPKQNVCGKNIHIQTKLFTVCHKQAYLC